MSKPKDPVIAVINYFENAELSLAQQTLAIAQAIVKNRQPKAASRPRTKLKRGPDGGLSTTPPLN